MHNGASQPEGSQSDDSSGSEGDVSNKKRKRSMPINVTYAFPGTRLYAIIRFMSSRTTMLT